MLLYFVFGFVHVVQGLSLQLRIERLDFLLFFFRLGLNPLAKRARLFVSVIRYQSDWNPVKVGTRLRFDLSDLSSLLRNLLPLFHHVVVLVVQAD